MAALVRFSTRILGQSHVVVHGAATGAFQPRIMGSCVNLNLNANQTSHKHTLVDIDPAVSEVLTGAIIPWAQQNFMQKLFFPYNYPLMHYMDLLSDYAPWWLAIVGTTATVKLVFSPFILKQNVIGIKLHNISPETQKLQEKVNEAMCTGNNYEAALLRTKLMLLYKEHDVSIWQRLWPSLIQAPAFMSIFLLLRRLSGQPVETMLTGGALWFENLTLPDPFFILPLMTSATLWLQMKYGFEGSVAPLANTGPIGTWVVRLMPVGLFALTYSFPAAVLVYWTSTNVATILFARFFRLRSVKSWLNIPECLKHDPKDLPMSSTTFRGQIRKAMDVGSSKRTSLDVRRLDEVAFRKAGVGPLTKTYKTRPPQPVKTD